jgi:hypothetical protein
LIDQEMTDMLVKVYKLIFADIEREEAWLNEMAQKGFNFQDVFLARYTFTECKPQEYNYRIELLEHSPSHPLSRQYLRFLEETGVECVTTSGRWAYFRKKATDGPFDLYSDLEAKIRHYKRNFAFAATLLLANFAVVAVYCTIAVVRAEPVAIVVCASPMVFTYLLARAAIHLGIKIRKLKAEQRIHE